MTNEIPAVRNYWDAQRKKMENPALIYDRFLEFS